MDDAREHEGGVARAAVGDEYLLAVEHPAIAVAFGGGSHAGWVRTVIRLSEAEAADRFSGLQQGQPTLFLLFGAMSIDRVHDQRALDADEAAEAGVAALEFLHDKAVLNVVHASTAIAFEVCTEESELTHLRDKLRREGTLIESVAHQRYDLFIDKLAGGLPDQQFVFGEEGIEVEVIDAGKAGHQFQF